MFLIESSAGVHVFVGVANVRHGHGPPHLPDDRHSCSAAHMRVRQSGKVVERIRHPCGRRKYGGIRRASGAARAYGILMIAYGDEKRLPTRLAVNHDGIANRDVTTDKVPGRWPR